MQGLTLYYKTMGKDSSQECDRFHKNRNTRGKKDSWTKAFLKRASRKLRKTKIEDYED